MCTRLAMALVSTFQLEKRVNRCKSNFFSEALITKADILYVAVALHLCLGPQVCRSLDEMCHRLVHLCAKTQGLLTSCVAQ